MQLFKQSLKKLAIIGMSVSMVSVFCISAPKADGLGSLIELFYLRNISNNTYYTALFAQPLLALSTNLTQADTSNSPSPSPLQVLQSYFANLGALFVNTTNMQNTPSYLLQLTADMVNQPLKNFQGRSPKVLDAIPNINDLSYPTVLGQPPVQKGAPASTYNYIKNASGVSIHHVVPGSNWHGTSENQTKYQDYYNTITAIESFNGYVLSHLVADNANNNQISTIQNNLLSQASSSNFIAQIATETIGQVLRQLLTFESQIYVLLTQLVQTQKQMVDAQAMTNGMLIIGNATNEKLLVENAQGTGPGG